jgi:hypothetical protein
LAVEAAAGETIIAAIHGNRANRAGSFFERNMPVGVRDVLAGDNKEQGGTYA